MSVSIDTAILMFAAIAAITWTVVLILPWQPWCNTETLEPEPGEAPRDLCDITVLIPARNEADVIAATLRALKEQGNGLRVVLIDDGSTDGTADVAGTIGGLDLTVVTGSRLPKGWSGKLWALEQGLQTVTTPWTLLLDADILLKPGMVGTLLAHAIGQRRSLVSIMASLRMVTPWEKLLMPAFIYFFKLLYPFRLANSAHPWFAAAAGGCILVKTQVLRDLGGFAAIRDALIDDCTLARKVKQTGARIWIGQSRAVVSLREYHSLSPIWEMIARTAFTQLQYSAFWLGVCTLLVITLFWAPVLELLHAPTRSWAIAAVAGMSVTYFPILRYYRRSALWILALPAIASVYLAMTWSSALRYWRGERSRWKNRVYATEG